MAPPLLAPRLTARGCTLPRWAIALTLAGSIFTVYATALQSGFFWDDFDFARPITLGEWLFTFRGTWNWTGIGNDYYRPLIVTLFSNRLSSLRLTPRRVPPDQYPSPHPQLDSGRLVLGPLGAKEMDAGGCGVLRPSSHGRHRLGLDQRTDRRPGHDVLPAGPSGDVELPASWRVIGARAGRSRLRRSTRVEEVAITFPAVALAYAACRQRFNRKCIRMIMFLAGMSAIYAIGWVVLFHEKLGAVNITTVASESSFIQFWHSLLRLLTFAFIPTYYPSYDFEFLGGESLTYLYVGSAFFVALGLALFVRGRAREKWLFVLASVWLVATVIPLFNIRYPDYMRLGYLPAVASGLAAAAVFAFASRYWNRAGKWLAVLLLLISVARMAPADQRIIEDWATGGELPK